MSSWFSVCKMIRDRGDLKLGHQRNHWNVSLTDEEESHHDRLAIGHRLSIRFASILLQILCYYLISFPLAKRDEMMALIDFHVWMWGKILFTTNQHCRHGSFIISREGKLALKRLVWLFFCVWNSTGGAVVIPFRFDSERVMQSGFFLTGGHHSHTCSSVHFTSISRQIFLYFHFSIRETPNETLISKPRQWFHCEPLFASTARECRVGAHCYCARVFTFSAAPLRHHHLNSVFTIVHSWYKHCPGIAAAGLPNDLDIWIGVTRRRRRRRRSRRRRLLPRGVASRPFTSRRRGRRVCCRWRGSRVWWRWCPQQQPRCRMRCRRFYRLCGMLFLGLIQRVIKDKLVCALVSSFPRIRNLSCCRFSGW